MNFGFFRNVYDSMVMLYIVELFFLNIKING